MGRSKPRRLTSHALSPVPALAARSILTLLPMPSSPPAERRSERRRRIGQRLRLTCEVFILGATVTGCFPLALTGAAVGTMAVADRRTIGAQTEDQEIEVKSLRVLNALPGGTTNASATSYNRKVLLTGQVDNEDAKKDVEQAVRSAAPNVREVFNELELATQIGFIDHTKDATMTARVKTALLRERSLSATSFKVITEASTVYLMGLVTEDEGDKAALIASRLSGVARVITLFEYLTDAELDRIKRMPMPADNTGTTPSRMP